MITFRQQNDVLDRFGNTVHDEHIGRLRTPGHCSPRQGQGLSHEHCGGEAGCQVSGDTLWRSSCRKTQVSASSGDRYPFLIDATWTLKQMDHVCTKWTKWETSTRIIHKIIYIYIYVILAPQRMGGSFRGKQAGQVPSECRVESNFAKQSGRRRRLPRPQCLCA